MIKKYKENITIYTIKCPRCKSKFTFQYRDVENFDDYFGISCPYCNRYFNFSRLPFVFRQKYKKELEGSDK